MPARQNQGPKVFADFKLELKRGADAPLRELAPGERLRETKISGCSGVQELGAH